MRYPRFHEALAVAAIGVAACQLGCRAKPGTTLHPARVPVQPYASHNFDPLAEFSESSPLQVAVFLTKAEAPSLGLVHVLREMGIPFFFTRNLDQALKHGLVLLYPAIEGDTLTKAQADQLRRYIEEGGTIFAQNVFWGPFKPIFGFYQYDPNRRRHWLAFKAGGDPTLEYLDRPEEQRIRLGSEKIQELFWTAGYSAMPSADVLARFEDRTAA